MEQNLDEIKILKLEKKISLLTTDNKYLKNIIKYLCKKYDDNINNYLNEVDKLDCSNDACQTNGINETNNTNETNKVGNYINCLEHIESDKFLKIVMGNSMRPSFPKNVVINDHCILEHDNFHNDNFHNDNDNDE